MKHHACSGTVGEASPLGRVQEKLSQTVTRGGKKVEESWGIKIKEGVQSCLLHMRESWQMRAAVFTAALLVMVLFCYGHYQTEGGNSAGYGKEGSLTLGQGAEVGREYAFDQGQGREVEVLVKDTGEDRDTGGAELGEIKGLQAAVQTTGLRDPFQKSHPLRGNTPSGWKAPGNKVPLGKNGLNSGPGVANIRGDNIGLGASSDNGTNGTNGTNGNNANGGNGNGGTPQVSHNASPVQPSLQGILWASQGACALLSLGQQEFSLALGESQGELQLLEVQGERVLVLYQGQEIQLSLAS